jgi:hypothetical protein
MSNYADGVPFYSPRFRSSFSIARLAVALFGGFEYHCDHLAGGKGLLRCPRM